MHSQAMIHGDLRGYEFECQPLPCLLTHFLIRANILIDKSGYAHLADFGLLTIVSDSTTYTASNSFAMRGTTRWMSPKLLNPDQFDLKDSRPTKQSDCYALGMAIYEVLSGQSPFALYSKISPHHRSRTRMFGTGSPTWQPLPPSAYGGTLVDVDDESCSTASYSCMFRHFVRHFMLTLDRPPQWFKRSHVVVINLHFYHEVTPLEPQSTTERTLHPPPRPILCNRFMTSISPCPSSPIFSPAPFSGKAT